LSSSQEETNSYTGMMLTFDDIIPPFSDTLQQEVVQSIILKTALFE